MRNRIGGAANFERTDGLKVLQLQVDFRRQVKTIEPDQWRAQGSPGDLPASVFDSRDGNRHSLYNSNIKRVTLTTCVPTGSSNPANLAYAPDV